MQLPGRIVDSADSLVAEALKNRPDLAVCKLNYSAAQRFAEAEKKLRYPAMSLVGVVGVVPIHQKNFSSQYSAAGLNISIPFLNGGLFAARRAEAEFRARGADKDVQAMEVQIAGDVRVAWLEADIAWRRLDVTARLVDQATTALRLAKARYDIGLSGILELTQAQLSQTSAQIAAANAKYDYLNAYGKSELRNRSIPLRLRDMACGTFRRVRNRNVAQPDILLAFGSRRFRRRPRRTACPSPSFPSHV